MKRWLVGALSLVISLFGLAGSLAVQAHVNAGQTSEEYAGADGQEDLALKSSTSRRNRARRDKLKYPIGSDLNFIARPSSRNQPFPSRLTPSTHRSPAHLRQFLQIYQT
jgi:hypothetical protein